MASVQYYLFSSLQAQANMENLIGFSRPSSIGTLNGVLVGLTMEIISVKRFG